ncbi:PAS-domain containing protein [Neptunomonas phycophila]|uniref:PAS-domain containing protein n=1 Tax=Neptunomonas phycophila TaxID=1572645 RepID=UPI0026E232C7|nr:PAS-domain containing protein [Neptunomonas phycophila]MDO6784300.1 PAS-domain containing protein [Neptunomonas phycophila]
MLTLLKRLRYYHPLRGMQARTRLMLAFTILAGSTMALAMVGWIGLNNTATALNEFERQALPDISRSLALAERTANLAAVAPYVANTSSPSMLQSLSNTLEEKIHIVLTMAKDIPELDNAAPQLPALLERLEKTVTELISLTRQHLLLREDIRQVEYRLTLLKERIKEKSLASNPNNRQVLSLLLMLDQLNSATQQSDMDRLSLIQQSFSDALDAFGAQDTLNASPLPSQMAPMLSEFQALGLGARNVYSVRRDQLILQQRRAFLLASTRAVSDQLSGEVKLFVDNVQQQITAQSDQVGNAVNSGKTSILLFTLLCFTATLGGIWVVRELTGHLGRVTKVMTRLAAGEKQLPTPAVERRDEIGELARAFEVFRENAVEIDRISQNLKEQSRLLETIFENINDGLSVFDENNRLIAWNPQYVSILELPANQLKPGMPIESIHPLLSQEAQDSWALDGMALDRDEVNQLRKQRTQRFERHFPGGRVVEFRSNPMPDGGFVTLYSDLTERKTIEAQLRQSQKMEVLGQLTGGVAHDFNNLLAAIFGNLQLLEDSLPAGGKQLRYAQRALSAAERGKSLTQRLLAFSRKQLLQPETTEVDGLIEGMLDLMEYSVGEQTEIQLDLQAAGWWVSVDPSQLENALLNLAINSSAAMPNGGSVSFKTRQLTDQLLNGRRCDLLAITVSDTGCGIPQSILRRVFEPFFTTKEIGEGSGLGLSMVYGFVKQSNGDIHITSAEGKGTQIEIWLPRVIETTTQANSTLLTQENTKGSGQHVLLVEDDAQVAQTAEALLESLGYQVTVVNHAVGAMDALDKANDVALVLTDINLGSAVNGVQLSDMINERWSALPVLLTSGLHKQQLKQRYGLLDSHALLAKPYTRDELAVAVHRRLNHLTASLGGQGNDASG